MITWLKLVTLKVLGYADVHKSTESLTAHAWFVVPLSIETGLPQVRQISCYCSREQCVLQGWFFIGVNYGRGEKLLYEEIACDTVWRRGMESLYGSRSAKQCCQMEKFIFNFLKIGEI